MKNKLLFSVVGVLGGLSVGSRGTEVSGQEHLIIEKIYVHGKNEQHVFMLFIYGPQCEKMYIFGYLGGFRGGGS